MYINNRLLKVMEYLRSENETTIKKTASVLNLSEKAVRYEIDKMNFLLMINGFPVIKKESKGKLISKEFAVAYDGKIFLDLINKNTKDERKEYVKLKLLLDGKINFSRVSIELDVSRTTIKNDIIEIEKEMSSNGIIINSIYINSEEIDIRNYIIKNYKEIISKYSYTEDAENYLMNVLLFNELSVIDVDSIRKFLTSISSELENRDNNFYEYVFAYLVVSYIRISKGYLINNIKNSFFLKNTKEYDFVSKQIKFLEKNLEIEFNESECLQLVDYILGFNSYGYNTSIFENWIEIKLLVQQIINEVNNYIDIDITLDEELLNGLLNHIKPVVYRMKNGLSIEEEVYFEAIKAYPELFTIIKNSLKKLEILINKKINNSEVALFTIHFLASIEKNKLLKNKYKNILLVCGGGYGTSMLVRKQLEKNYDINIVDILSHMELLNYNFQTVDLVITTLTLNDSLSEKINIPIMKITPFFTIEDENLLKNYLVKKDSDEDKMNKIINLIKTDDAIKENIELQKKFNNIIKGEKETVVKGKRLIDFISEDRIQVVKNVDTWQKALELCGEILIEKNEIKRDYIKEIINIAESFGVHFILENNVAIPHGEVFKNVEKSCISILSIKDSVIFPENRNVSLMFLIGAANITEHVKSIEEIINLTQQKELLQQIYMKNNSHELYNFFKSLYLEKN